MKGKIDTLVPDIPFSTSGLTSLRDQLSAYVSVPSIGGLADITSKFGGLTSLTGYANINLSDLASSAFSLGASFDPCSLAGDLKIPNIVADSTGALQALPSIQPDIGATFAAAKIALTDQSIIDNLSLAIAENIPIVEDMGAEATEIIQANIVTAHTGMGDLVKKLPTGEEVVEKKDKFIEEIKVRSAIWNADPPPMSDAFLQEIQDLRMGKGESKRMAEYKVARKAALATFKEQSGLTKSALLRGFSRAVNNALFVNPDCSLNVANAAFLATLYSAILFDSPLPILKSCISCRKASDIGGGSAFHIADLTFISSINLSFFSTTSSPVGNFFTKSPIPVCAVTIFAWMISVASAPISSTIGIFSAIARLKLSIIDWSVRAIFAAANVAPISGWIDGNACNAPVESATIFGILRSPAREHGSNDAPRLNADEARSLRLIFAYPVSDVRPPNLDVISARPPIDGTDTYAES
jgi:hypothetical protein